MTINKRSPAVARIADRTA